MAAKKLPKASLLLVDDDHYLRDLLKFLLENHGFQVRLAVDGQSALRYFQDHASEVDLALLDMRLGDMSGVQTLHELRRIRPDLPAILMTAYPESIAQELVAGASFLAVFTKPFHINELVALIHKALDIE